MFRMLQEKSLFYKLIKQTDSMRMEVSSPKLAIGVRGKQDVAEDDCYRHHILLKLLFAMMFWLDFGSFSKII